MYDNLKTRAAGLLAIAWLGGVLLLWHYLVAGKISPAVAVWLFSMGAGSYFLGDLFLKFALGDNELFANLPARLAVGVILGNVLLYAAVLLLPFGPALDWLIIFAGAALAWWLARRPDPGATLPAVNGAEAVLLFVAPVAVTLWCRELFSPVQYDGPVVVIRAWQDIYYHVSEIAGFAASRGYASISDLHMGGAPIMPYHHASYMLSGALVDATGISALAAYACLLVPLGLLVAALGAYALASSLFGRWPALAGSLALLVLPDAAQQGSGNPLFGYHWMMQSAPACGYGLACGAIVFMLLLEGCRSGRYQLVAGAYGFVLLTLLHKAQIFFAIAYLALILPALFFRGLTTRRRVLSWLLLTAVFGAAMAAAQAFPGVPVMRLDGSGLLPYSRLVLNNQSAGMGQELFGALFTASAGHWPLRAAAFAVLLVIVTYGFHSLLYLVQVGRLRRDHEARVWTLPLLAGALYLLMAACLAEDDRRIGMPDELLHRPFLWAYFIMVLWAGAATYRHWWGKAPPPTAAARWSLAAAALALLFVPGHFGTGIQTFPGWGFGHHRLPAGLVQSATFIRAHSQPGELVQDSMAERGMILSALSERRPFASGTNGTREPAGLRARMEALEAAKNLRDPGQAAAFMRLHAIRWYLISPDDQVRWAEGAGLAPAFQSGGFRVYRF